MEIHLSEPLTKTLAYGRNHSASESDVHNTTTQVSFILLKVIILYVFDSKPSSSRYEHQYLYPPQYRSATLHTKEGV